MSERREQILKLYEEEYAHSGRWPSCAEVSKMIQEKTGKRISRQAVRLHLLKTERGREILLAVKEKHWKGHPPVVKHKTNYSRMMETLDD